MRSTHDDESENEHFEYMSETAAALTKKLQYFKHWKCIQVNKATSGFT